jgi:hypothetical protein
VEEHKHWIVFKPLNSNGFAKAKPFLFYRPGNRN